MSKEAAKALIEKMIADENFREKVMAGKDVPERIKTINSEGFDCTAEEIEAQSKDLGPEATPVAGAKGNCYAVVNVWCCTCK